MGKVSFVARLSYCNDVIYVTFPDVSEAHTFGETREEAITMAKDAIECWFSDGTPLPPLRRFDEALQNVELYKDDPFAAYYTDDGDDEDEGERGHYGEGPEQSYEIVEIVADIE
jgi:predicted RNase H-like HicB family nuclease